MNEHSPSITPRPANAEREPHARARKATLEAQIRDERRATLIVNTASRQGRRHYATAKRLLRDHGITLEAAYPVRDPARLPGIVQEVIFHGPKLIIVGGGDGTISSIVDCFVHRDSVLGILPLGTANSFARTLGIPLDIEAAVDVLLHGKVVDIDLGMINDDYFANAAAIGLPASIARSMPQGIKRWLGRFGYLLVASVRLLRHRPFRCRVTHGGETLCVDALEVRIANGRFQGGVLTARSASVESRDLVIQIITGTSRWTIARFWLRAGLGLSTDRRNVQVVRTQDVIIDTEPMHYVSIDGEAATQTPIRACIAHQALLVMAPRAREDLG